MSDITSHRNKNRLLVGCLSTVIGGPLMCCCLFGIFTFLLPAIAQADTSQFPMILVGGGLVVFGILMVIALGVIGMYLYRRKFPGLGAAGGQEDQHAKVARIRQISLLVVAFGMPLCFILVGVIAYLLATKLG
jgi:hypothetical protein